MSDAVMDSLPYIDALPIGAERQFIDQLVQQEIDSGDINRIARTDRDGEISENGHDHDYADDTDIWKSKSSLMEDMLARLRSKQRIATEIAPMTIARLKKQSVEELTASLRQCALVFEYTRRRSENLRLMDAYGENAWLLHLSELESELRTIEKALFELKAQTNALNAERKQKQTEAGERLALLNSQIRDLISSNVETRLAIIELRKTRNEQ